MCAQRRFRSVYALTQSDQNLPLAHFGYPTRTDQTVWMHRLICAFVGESTRPIRHSGGDDTSSRWHGRLHDPWLRSCNHSRWQDTLWLGAEFHCLPLQGKGGCIGKGATTVVSSWQSRSWKSWRGLWTASSDSWCQSTIPSLALSQAEAQQMQALLSGSCKRII